MKLVIHPSTRRSIDAFVNHPTHALALVAPGGYGKKSLSLYIANQLLDINSGSDNISQVLTIMPSDSRTIGIEQIRRIISFLKLKKQGTRSIRRVILIHDAHTLTVEAQNALLKTLEEHPHDSSIILTVSDKTKLLPTIISRVFLLNVIGPSQADAYAYFSSKYDPETIKKRWYMSDGRIGLMASLLTQTNHPLLPYIDRSKSILSQTRYDRLRAIEDIAKSDVGTFIDALHIIALAGFNQSVQKGNVAGLRKWHAIRQKVYEAHSALQKRANQKLILTNLLLEI